MKDEHLKELIERLKYKTRIRYYELLFGMSKVYKVKDKDVSYYYNDNGNTLVISITINMYHHRSAKMTDIYTLNKELQIYYLCHRNDKNIDDVLNKIPVE